MCESVRESHNIPTMPTTTVPTVPTPPSSRARRCAAEEEGTTRRSSRRARFRPRGAALARPRAAGGVTDENATPRGMEASPMHGRCVICLSPMHGRRRKKPLEAGDEAQPAGADPGATEPEIARTDRDRVRPHVSSKLRRRPSARSGAGGRQEEQTVVPALSQAARGRGQPDTPSDKIRLPTPEGRSAVGASFSLRAAATPRSFSQWRLRLAHRRRPPAHRRSCARLRRLARRPPPRPAQLPAASAGASVDSEAVAAASRRGRAAVARSLALASLAVQERFRFPTALC